jgi:hypothetical protein
LYNQSLLLEGSKIKDPAAFARSVAKLMTGSAKGKDTALLRAISETSCGEVTVKLFLCNINVMIPEELFNLLLRVSE